MHLPGAIVVRHLVLALVVCIVHLGLLRWTLDLRGAFGTMQVCAFWWCVLWLALSLAGGRELGDVISAVQCSTVSSHREVRAMLAGSG